MAFDELDALSEEDFTFFRELIFKLAGISLGSTKRELVASRIKTLLRKSGISTFKDYRILLSRSVDNSPEHQNFINLLTTNKTDFFREPEHFDFLKDLVRSHKKGVFKVWCAASSTGEEPYTIAMVLKKYLPAGSDFKVIATDIDTNVLSRAQNGVYPIERVDEIPEDFRTYVNIGRASAEGWFRISPQIREYVCFRTFNLNGNTDLGENDFDVIFCRNVLIYFSENTIENLAHRLYQAMKRSGHLIIGHSETLRQKSSKFEVLKPSVYIRA